MSNPSDHDQPWAIWLTAIVSLVVVCIEIAPQVLELTRTEIQPPKNSTEVLEERKDSDLLNGSEAADRNNDLATREAVSDVISHSSTDSDDDDLDKILVDDAKPITISPHYLRRDLAAQNAVEKVKTMRKDEQIELPSSRINYAVIGIQKDDGFWAFSRLILLESIEAGKDDNSRESDIPFSYIVEENKKTGERIVSEIKKEDLSSQLARAINSKQYTSFYSDLNVNW